MPAARAQLVGACLRGTADVFTVVFDYDIEPEPFYERPVILALLAPVNRPGWEPVATDYRFVGTDVILAAMRAEVDNGCPVLLPGRQLSGGPGGGDVGGEVPHARFAEPYLPDTFLPLMPAAAACMIAVPCRNTPIFITEPFRPGCNWPVTFR